MRSCDVAIVGGGPAGLATALACRARGLDVVVVEPHAPPLDKACGEGVMPDGAARLRRWGVELDGVAFRGIRFVEGERSACADFPSGPGIGVRRTRLHAALLAAARNAGTVYAHGVRALSIESDNLLTSDGPIRAGTIVGADGLRSRVRGWLGLEARAPRRRRFGVRRHFAIAPWSEHVEVYWSDGAEAYVTPVGAGEVGVAMLWSRDRGGFDRLLGRFPELAARLAGVAVTSSDRGAGPLEQRTRGVVRGRAALVGDAAGYVDAITGEGMALAFAEAEALAESVVAGNLADYARASRRIRRVPELATRMLLLVEHRSGLRRRLFAALAREPRLFAELLGLLTGGGKRSPPAVALHLAVRLATA